LSRRGLKEEALSNNLGLALYCFGLLAKGLEMLGRMIVFREGRMRNLICEGLTELTGFLDGLLRGLGKMGNRFLLLCELRFEGREMKWLVSSTLIKVYARVSH
jgi:hypothetical protein